MVYIFFVAQSGRFVYNTVYIEGFYYEDEGVSQMKGVLYDDYTRIDYTGHGL